MHHSNPHKRDRVGVELTRCEDDEGERIILYPPAGVNLPVFTGPAADVCGWALRLAMMLDTEHIAEIHATLRGTEAGYTRTPVRDLEEEV